MSQCILAAKASHSSFTQFSEVTFWLFSFLGGDQSYLENLIYFVDVFQGNGPARSPSHLHGQYLSIRAYNCVFSLHSFFFSPTLHGLGTLVLLPGSEPGPPQ